MFKVKVTMKDGKIIIGLIDHYPDSVYEFLGIAIHGSGMKHTEINATLIKKIESFKKEDGDTEK